MSHEMITDISLDHLPDLSEASVSFQIPPDSSSAEFLLADNTDGFDLLRGAADDNSFTPLAPTPLRGPALTLSELTPKAESRLLSLPSQSPTPGPSSSNPSETANPQPLRLGHPSPNKGRKTPRARSKLRDIAFDSPLVSEERFEQLRAEVETLGQVNEIPTHVDLTALSQEAAETAPKSDPVLRPKTKLKPRTNSKPTVADGGISKIPAPSRAHVLGKNKSKPSSTREPQTVQPFTACQPSTPQSMVIDTEELLVPPATMNDDISMTADNTQITRSSTGGVAERLVSYSQKLISSIGLYKPRPESSFTEDTNGAARTDNTCTRTRSSSAAAFSPSTASQSLSPSTNDIPSAKDEPLRLSEISPHKVPRNNPQQTSASRAGSPQHGQRAMSPMRQGKKRPSMDVDLSTQEHHQRKKGKTVLPSAEIEAERGSSEQEGAIPQGSAGKNLEDLSISDTRNSRFPTSTLPNARTKYRPKLNSSSQRKAIHAVPQLSNSRQAHGTISKGKGKYVEERPKASTTRSASSLNRASANSRFRHHATRVDGKNAQSARAHERSGPSSVAELPLLEKKPSATLPGIQLTKPVAFTFRVDARLEARKAEDRLAFSEQGQLERPQPHSHPVPDFKALHQSHPAALVGRKENVVPRVPVVPFNLVTEQRAKEREKFDEMVRRKEEEMERLKEEQRRLQQEEEERAIKELRRKAIPKANEVPEWYADVPKKKGTV
ncbi:hypothetical protein HYDPIDRAFT_26908 [Hydnomerulius pinastri MD-312]|nr:hypothetical protein HYDPIDRAFT_26908 [Hydnomerulius pinastri MD-312]